MISEFNQEIVPQATPVSTILDLTQYPDALVTTYTTVGQLVLVVGIVCLIGGFFIGRKMAAKAHS